MRKSRSIFARSSETCRAVRHAPRGVFLDRKGVPLVVNVPQYRLLKPCTNAGSPECVTYLTKAEGDAVTKQGLPAGEYLEVDYLRQYPYEDALSHVIGYTGELSGEELKSEYYKTRNYGLGDRVGRMGAEETYNERLRGRDGKDFVEVDAAGRILRTLGRQEELPGEDISLSPAGHSPVQRFNFSRRGWAWRVKPGALPRQSNPNW